LPQLGEKCAYLQQDMLDKLIFHRTYINREGIDIPEVLNWRWDAAAE
jgi:xylulose-5-phosphate/fructose-6-phosphate phosphoketolase